MNRQEPAATERRIYPSEIRAAKRDDGGELLTGYAAKFGVLSEDLGGFREEIRKGAFSEAIAGDVRALWNHKSEFVLGRTKSGTLRLAEDEIGLRYEVDLPAASWARDLYASVERGDVDQSSFGFDVEPGGQEWREVDGVLIRTLLRIARLWDVSPVTFPAYPAATVEARSILEQAKTLNLLPGSGEPRTGGLDGTGDASRSTWAEARVRYLETTQGKGNR